MSGLIGNLPADPKDPWALAQSGYSPDKFYTRSTDGHGHSETDHVKVSPAISAAISEAVEKFPAYRTRGDFHRDADIHRLKQLNEWFKLGINMQPVEVEIRMAELQMVQAKRAYWNDYIKQADDTLRDLVEEGDYEAAIYFLERAAGVDDMSPPYLLKLGAVIDRHRDAIGRSYVRD